MVVIYVQYLTHNLLYICCKNGQSKEENYRIYLLLVNNKCLLYDIAKCVNFAI